MAVRAYAVPIFHLIGDPSQMGADTAQAYFEDGLLIVEDGLIRSIGSRRDLESQVPAASIVKFSTAMIVPGFIDAHIHYLQIEIIAAPGKQLMDWLETYTFPSEAAFSDKPHALTQADNFLDELLRNGTTSALVFATVHKVSVEALFEKALARNMRIISGKVLMDRLAPASLRDTAETGYEDSKVLIDTWHNKGRLGYAITPRFAPACSEEQLQSAGELLKERPDVLLHSHLSENQDEVQLVKELFPDADDYVDVYDKHGLMGDRSVFAHGIHLSNDEWTRLGRAGAGIAFCPTSNLFLGSGLFDFAAAQKHGIKVGLGTDVGGGTSFSLLQTMNEAYKVCQLRGQNLDVLQSFYLATLGSAKTLHIDDKVGNLDVGKEADFLVLDMAATPLITKRLGVCRTLEEKLFALSILGDDRVVRRTYVAGELAYSRA